MKKILLTALAFLAFGAALGQSFVYDWHGAAALTNYQKIIHKESGIYLQGSFGIQSGQQIDLDPTIGIDLYTSTISVGSTRFITKLDTAGQYLFSIVPDPNDVYYSDFDVNDDGSLVIIGTADSANADLDPGAGVVGLYGNYPSASIILFLDQNGSYQAHIEYPFSYGGAPYPGVSLYRTSIDATNNVLYVSGIIQGLVDMDFTAGTDMQNGDQSDGTVFVSKIDLNSSSYAWSSTMRLDSGYYSYGINDLLPGNNKVTLVGTFKGDTLSYSHSNATSYLIRNTSIPYADRGFVIDVDANGGFIRGGANWANNGDFDYLESDNDPLNGFVITCELYAPGDSAQIALTGPEVWVSQEGFPTLVVAKYDGQHNLAWYSTIFSRNYLTTNDVKIKNGKIAVVGGYQDSLWFHSGPNVLLALQSPNEYVGEVVVMDANGALIAANNDHLAPNSGPNSFSELQALALDSDGDLLLCGILRGEVDFDPGIGIASSNATDTANYHYAGYILRLNLDGYVGTEAANGPQQVLLYPNPATDRLTISSLTEFTEFKVYDLQGRLQLSRSLSPVRNVQLDVTSLAAGMYLIEMANDQGKVSTRFVKQ